MLRLNLQPKENKTQKYLCKNISEMCICLWSYILYNDIIVIRDPDNRMAKKSMSEVENVPPMTTKIPLQRNYEKKVLKIENLPLSCKTN